MTDQEISILEKLRQQVKIMDVPISHLLTVEKAIEKLKEKK